MHTYIQQYCSTYLMYVYIKIIYIVWQPRLWCTVKVRCTSQVCKWRELMTPVGDLDQDSPRVFLTRWSAISLNRFLSFLQSFYGKNKINISKSSPIIIMTTIVLNTEDVDLVWVTVKHKVVRTDTYCLLRHLSSRWPHCTHGQLTYTNVRISYTQKEVFWWNRLLHKHTQITLFTYDV